MSKKVKVNGKWIVVDDADVQEGDEPEGEPAGDEPEEPQEDTPSDTGSEDDSEKAINETAKNLAKKVMSEVNAQLGTQENKELNEKVDKVLKYAIPQDAKLNKILGGKDLISDIGSLTKEEKIVGFFHALVNRNEFALKALTEGTNSEGGFLFPDEFHQELIKELPEINVMRNWVRIITMRRNAMDITSLVGRPQVTWTNEAVEKTTTTATFSQATLNARKVAAILRASDELIEDSDIFDVVQEIIRMFAERIAEEEERVIWEGNNTTEPQGINTAGTVPTIAASGQDFDDLIETFHALPRKYRNSNTCAWFMTDETMAEVRKLKDANNNYILQNDVQSPTQMSILGKPVVISDWVTTGSIFFGDFRRAYFLGDRKRMTVKVSQDETRSFTHDLTAIRVVHRIGGLVVLPNAARELTGFTA